MSTPPSGTVTFLFTDIEGSTRRWEENPRAMRAAIDTHDNILREAIEKNGGYVFETIGDAFCAAFPTAPQALKAAVAAQRDIEHQDWGPDIDPIRVRMALHTGAVEERNGRYSGSTIERVTRLLPVGYGGQTLLSMPAEELVHDQMPPGVQLVDLGERRLRDLTHTEHIFQMLVDGLNRTFPPLKTLEGRPNNLPVRPTPLIGREREVEECVALLRSANVRLLTLTGPGGTGKTRLGLQVAATLLDDFKDGVYAVGLAPLNDPQLVVTTIAQTLGVRESGGQTLLPSLKDYLRDKEMLLLLDNFEQLLEAAPLVWELLSTARELKVLVTSRAMLHLSVEQEYAVPPLLMPDTTDMPALDALARYESVALFVARAQAVKHDFALTQENATAVAEICARLEGLPLAIELAAARIKILPPRAMLTRLTSRLGLLTGGGRDMPPRQQTMRAAIEWSYDLLDDAEQELFRQVCVFVLGCTLESMEAVVRVDKTLDLDVLDGISSLVNKSLIRQMPGHDPEPRFSMLEMIREFGLEKLEVKGESESVQRRHAEFFRDLAETARRELIGVHQSEWLNRLEMEHGNLTAAMEWSNEHREAETGLRMAGALWNFWYMRSYLTEGSKWLLGLLALPEASPRTQVRASALNGAGNLVYNQGDYAVAKRLHEESLSISRELADQRAISASLNNLGLIAKATGDYKAAHELFEEALATNRAINNRNWEAINLNNLANVLHDQGNYGRARDLQEKSLAIFTSLQNDWGVAMSASDLGKIVFEQGEYALARSLYERSMEIQHKLEDTRNIADTLNKYGLVALSQSDHQGANATFDRSLTLFRALGDKKGIATSLHYKGRVAYRLGEYNTARRLFEESLMLRKELGDKRDIADSLNNLGILALATGEYEEAMSQLEKSLDLWRDIGNLALVPTSLNNMGLVAINLGEYKRARELLEESLDKFQESGEKLGVAFALLNLGLAVSGDGEYTQARGYYNESLVLFNELGDKLHTATCMIRLAGLCAVMNEDEQAATLSGAAEAALRDLGTPLAPFERPYYEPAKKAAMSRLGQQRFSELQEQGRTMGLEGAVPYALQADKVGT